MKKKEEDIKEIIHDYSLEEIMGERFARYSKYIIQDRAIPDARDGLKPVQRRILYSMYKEKNTYDHGYRKSAKTVGDVIGNYHPHGDTSIYDAMVRMSQSWKTRLPYIDMHGNNGSIDGDSPAAYRYTEARLSKISNEMVKDIDKDTVEFAPNFDDTTKEPTVLPAKFPALLVYGAQGISAGYATNIPPHNLTEVIDATIYRIDNPESTLEELMKFVKGPDFPTGGVACGKEGMIEAYKTGKGKIMVRSKYQEEDVGGKTSIVITEIPFEVNKALMVKKMDDIRLDKKIDGILEVRDESAADVRVVIDLKKGANKELIINYLLKNTDMQISYNFNMTSIVKKRPKLLGLVKAIDAFIIHQKEVITRRTNFDLEHASFELHIVEGLIKCLSILDQVIKTIRASKNKKDAKENLVKEYDFSLDQAEAIVTLQLYKLTNTDVVDLEDRSKLLNKIINGLKKILGSEEVLKQVMKEELTKVKDTYPTERRTVIEDEIKDIKIDKINMITKEDVIVVLTKDGYIKRSSLRSYQSSDMDITLKENDYILGKYFMNTIDTLLIFTNKGNYLYVPVDTIFDIKYKDMGKHISNLIEIDEDEEVISAIPVYSFTTNKSIIIATSLGMIKRVKISEFQTTRYKKAINCIKLSPNDFVVVAIIKNYNEIFIATKKGYGLIFKTIEIPVIGIKTKGVKAINLKNDSVVSVNNFSYNDTEFISIITNRTGKRVRIKEFDLSTRARRGLLIIREIKTNPLNIVKTFTIASKESIGIKTTELDTIKLTNLNICDRYQSGNQIAKNDIVDSFDISSALKEEDVYQKELEEIDTTPKQISLKEIDDKLMSVDEFLQ